MSGRITSTPPALNAHGVPYSVLLERERRLNEVLLSRYREALEAWLAADDQSPNSRRRWTLLARARDLSVRALS